MVAVNLPHKLLVCIHLLAGCLQNLSESGDRLPDEVHCELDIIKKLANIQQSY